MKRVLIAPQSAIDCNLRPAPEPLTALVLSRSTYLRFTLPPNHSILEDVLESTGTLVSDAEAAHALATMPRNATRRYALSDVLQWWRSRAETIARREPPKWRKRLTAISRALVETPKSFLGRIEAVVNRRWSALLGERQTAWLAQFSEGAPDPPPTPPEDETTTPTDASPSKPSKPPPTSDEDQKQREDLDDHPFHIAATCQVGHVTKAKSSIRLDVRGRPLGTSMPPTTGKSKVNNKGECCSDLPNWWVSQAAPALCQGEEP